MTFFAQQIQCLDSMSNNASIEPNLFLNSIGNNIYMIDNSNLIITQPNFDYMGLDLSSETITKNIPVFFQQQPKLELLSTVGEFNNNFNQIAQINKNYLSSYGIRKKTLCKNGLGKVGLKIKSVQNGIYVCTVVKNSPAAVAGFRFADQILAINDVSVSGLNEDQLQELLKSCPVNKISVIVRDRPFERSVTLSKDANGSFGFEFKNGQIIRVAKNSSADENGLPADGHILEINGLNVVAVKDREIQKILDGNTPTVTITIVPKFIHKHIIENIPLTLFRKDGDKILLNV